MTDKQREQMEDLEPTFIQVQLEAVSDLALETGDTMGYGTREWFEARLRYLKLRTSNKQKAATNYNGGGPGGNNGNK